MKINKGVRKLFLFILTLLIIGINSSNIQPDSYETANDKAKDTDSGINLNDIVTAEVVKRSINGSLDQSSDTTNATGGHSSESNVTHEDGDGHHSKEHVSIHVASWNFHHVESPLIISLFLLAAGIAKLGEDTEICMMSYNND